MLSEDLAKKTASTLNGTYARKEVVDKLTQEVTQEARGKRKATVGSHITNGVKRFVVHVKHEDKHEPAFTIGSAEHPAFPLA
jgi:hypothetical protein